MFLLRKSGTCGFLGTPKGFNDNWTGSINSQRCFHDKATLSASKRNPDHQKIEIFFWFDHFSCVYLSNVFYWAKYPWHVFPAVSYGFFSKGKALWAWIANFTGWTPCYFYHLSSHRFVRSHSLLNLEKFCHV